MNFLPDFYSEAEVFIVKTYKRFEKSLQKILVFFSESKLTTPFSFKNSLDFLHPIDNKYVSSFPEFFKIVLIFRIFYFSAILFLMINIIKVKILRF